MKLELAITALLILAVIPSAYCLGEGTPYVPTEEGVYYRVDVFDMEKWGYKPEDFWNLTNPDADILRAINNPGVFVKASLVNPNETPPPGTFLHECYDRDCPVYFTYNGSYYALYRNVIIISYDARWSTKGSGFFGKVVLVEDPEDPENYTLVTNLDPYTLAAVEHLDTWIMFDFNYLRDHPDEQSIIRPGNDEDSELVKFRYEGEYYRCIGVIEVFGGWSPPRDWTKEIAAGIGISTVAVAAVAFIVYRKRKNQATLGKH